jgi:hypothetical protein
MRFWWVVMWRWRWVRWWWRCVMEGGYIGCKGIELLVESDDHVDRPN